MSRYAGDMISLANMPRNERTRARLLRGVDHIERHIGEDLSLADVAARAALSEYHFHRQFRAHFGVPVMDYVRRRRLAKAAAALLQSRRRILEIALDAGFQSQEAFGRAFRKVYRTAPAAFRARGRDVPWLSSVPISDAALAMLPGLGANQPRIATIDGFAVDGIAARLDGAGRVRIPQLWEQLARTLGHVRFTSEECIGISGGDEAVLGGILDYMAGIRAGGAPPPATPPATPLATPLERRTIPGGTYLVFRFAGDFARVSQAYDFIFGTWLPGSRHTLLAGPNFTRQTGGSGHGIRGDMEIWIPVEVVA